MDKMDKDRTVSFAPVRDDSAQQILQKVFDSLKAKGYDPVNQIVGDIISGDPTYITSYNNARSLIRRVERDELLEEVLTYYIRGKING